MKLYSYYKDGFYSGIYDDQSGGKFGLISITVKQEVKKIPTITFTCYDPQESFSIVGGEFCYKGEYVSGTTKFSISDTEHGQIVTATLEFPVELPEDLSEGFVGSGCYYDNL